MRTVPNYSAGRQGQEANETPQTSPKISDRSAEIERTAAELRARFIASNVDEKTPFRMRALDHAVVSAMSDAEFRLLYLLLRCGAPDGTNIRWGCEKLAMLLRCSEKSIDRPMAKLEKAGWLKSELKWDGTTTSATRRALIPDQLMFEIASIQDKTVGSNLSQRLDTVGSNLSQRLSPDGQTVGTHLSDRRVKSDPHSPVLVPLEKKERKKGRGEREIQKSEFVETPQAGPSAPDPRHEGNEFSNLKEGRTGMEEGMGSDPHPSMATVDVTFADVPASMPVTSAPNSAIATRVRKRDLFDDGMVSVFAEAIAAKAVALRSVQTPARQPRQKSALHCLPEDWTPAGVYAWAEGEGVTRQQVDQSAVRMRNWAESKGERRASWEASLRNWVLRDRDDGKFSKPASNAGPSDRLSDESIHGNKIGSGYLADVMAKVPGSTPSLLREALLQVSDMEASKLGGSVRDGFITRPEKGRIVNEIERKLRRAVAYETHGRPEALCGGPVAKIGINALQRETGALSEAFVEGVLAKYPSFHQSDIYYRFEAAIKGIGWASYGPASQKLLESRFETEIAEAHKASVAQRQLEREMAERHEQHRLQKEEQLRKDREEAAAWDAETARALALAGSETDPCPF